MYTDCMDKYQSSVRTFLEKLRNDEYEDSAEIKEFLRKKASAKAHVIYESDGCNVKFYTKSDIKSQKLFVKIYGYINDIFDEVFCTEADRLNVNIPWGETLQNTDPDY